MRALNPSKNEGPNPPSIAPNSLNCRKGCFHFICRHESETERDHSFNRSKPTLSDYPIACSLNISSTVQLEFYLNQILSVPPIAGTGISKKIELNLQELHFYPNFKKQGKLILLNSASRESGHAFASLNLGVRLYELGYLFKSVKNLLFYFIFLKKSEAPTCTNQSPVNFKYRKG